MSPGHGAALEGLFLHPPKGGMQQQSRRGWIENFAVTATENMPVGDIPKEHSLENTARSLDPSDPLGIQHPESSLGQYLGQPQRKHYLAARKAA